MEIYTNLVTKQEIDTLVLPFTSEDSLFNSSVNETLLFDIRPKVGDTIYADLENNGKISGATYSTDTQEFLSLGGKQAIMYYIVARTIRKNVTLTRYGSTIKLNDSMASESASNSQIVAQSNYYKKMGDDLLQALLPKLNHNTNNYSYNVKVIGR